jgi:hypothetical protein
MMMTGSPQERTAPRPGSVWGYRRAGRRTRGPSARPRNASGQAEGRPGRRSRRWPRTAMLASSCAAPAGPGLKSAVLDHVPTALIHHASRPVRVVPSAKAAEERRRDVQERRRGRPLRALDQTSAAGRRPARAT